MAYDYEEKKRKQISSMKSIMDYGMGGLFLLLGLFFLFHNYLNIDFSRFSKTPLIDNLSGGISNVYGAWRIYRGYKKNFLNERKGSACICLFYYKIGIYMLFVASIISCAMQA